ncbi:MazG family protein [Agilicoccus flavus]|uniref:MazG family protein n=1 Tax=Agilicoccus flavus TaxID=2775968 RepID=UPI001CF69BF7|nr:MazG family protein [Agilicoccus flavus]
MAELVAVMDRLRSPGGCPWDAQQTHATLAPYAVEEAHELADAIAAGDPDDIADELGDVLLQVVFHARVAADAPDPAARFDLDDVAGRIVAKLRRRHPHVFADGSARTPGEVEVSWEEIKRREKPERTGPLDGLPTGLPPLERAAKVASRLSRAGRADEVSAAAAALPDGPGARLLREALACAATGVDPTTELRAALREVESRLS